MILETDGMRLSMTALAAILCAGLCALAVGDATAAAPAAKPAPGDWRPIDAANTLVIDTNQGRIFVELYPEVAPLSAQRLETLARQHFYDGLTFFRVIDDFMDQTGDPKNTGEGASPLPNVPAEFTFRRAPSMPFTVVDRPEGVENGFLGALPVTSKPIAQAELTADGKVWAYGLFCPGVLGMARAQDPDSANSQFFLMRQAHDTLNGKYTAVGRVVVGLDVVRKIKVGEPPTDPQDKMLKVQVLADLPPAQRPDIKVLDTTSAYFIAQAAQTKAARGVDYTLCDTDVAAKVN